MGAWHAHCVSSGQGRYHFLELLAQLVERFGTRVHAYVLRDNYGNGL